VVDSNVACCGMAGDRGLCYPDLPASSLSQLSNSLRQSGIDAGDGRDTIGVSTSRTCEMGLSLHSGVHFRNLFYLLDSCTVSISTHNSNTDSTPL